MPCNTVVRKVPALLPLQGSQFTNTKEWDWFRKSLTNKSAIGHVRYSTTGSSIAKNAQPFVVSHGNMTLAIGHNGNLTNAKQLRGELEERGSIFQTTMDSEIIVHLLARNLKAGIEEALRRAVSQIEGAYSCTLMTEDPPLPGDAQRGLCHRLGNLRP